MGKKEAREKGKNRAYPSGTHARLSPFEGESTLGCKCFTFPDDTILRRPSNHGREPCRRRRRKPGRRRSFVDAVRDAAAPVAECEGVRV